MTKTLLECARDVHDPKGADQRFLTGRLDGRFVRISLAPVDFSKPGDMWQALVTSEAIFERVENGGDQSILDALQNLGITELKVYK